MRQPLTPRNLTHDQKKAAEAAFRGLPFDPSWSAAARAVYEGILNASSQAGATATPVSGQEPGQPGQKETVPDQPAQTAPLQIRSEGENGSRQVAAPQQLVGTREEAIQAGLLIDVSPLAQSLGLSLPVGVTKPLWDLAITASRTIPDEQHEARLRDVLMALRLRLAASRTTIPLIEFPALLAFPPEPVPQLCVLHAVAHGDPGNLSSLTLALRDEVSLIISPLNN